MSRERALRKQALEREREALEQQRATAEILRVMSSSPSDVQPVFDAVARKTSELCNGDYAIVVRFDGELLHLAAEHNARPGSSAPTAQQYPRRPGRDTPSARAVLERAVVHIQHADKDPDLSQELVRRIGAGSFLSVPLLREGRPIGAIGVSRVESGPFPAKQIELVKVFADQAVIAIENVRLFNETKEALEQQTATAQILKVIAGSPADVQPVFDAILAAAMTLCHANMANVYTFDGELIHLAALVNRNPEYGEAIRQVFPRPPGRDTAVGRAVLLRDVVEIPDVLEDREYGILAQTLAGGFRSALAVPLIREKSPIGAIIIGGPEPGPFPEKQVALLKSFADQAVIAIENARLFNETKEALEQQTAISEILRVISDSPTDVKPVLETVAMHAAKICDASDARIWLVEGDAIRHAAGFGDVPITVETGDTRPIERGLLPGRAILDRAPVHVEDIQAVSSEDLSLSREIARHSGWRTAVSVPLLREAHALGAITLRRMEVRPFTEKQISLLKTFADQAAIAIENARLFNETKEALERQTATADILKVISSSPTDVQPVFQAILENATRLCGAHLGFLSLYDGDKWQTVAHLGANPQFAEWIVGRGRFTPSPGAGLDQMLAKRVPVHIADYRETSAYRERYPMSIKLVELGGVRSYLAVPMLKDGRIVGGITVYRADVRMFEQKQIDLLSTFADQAVIAIENVRLFKELQATNANLREALEQQTATSELLKIIGRSSFDLGPVFETLAKNTVRLCEAERAYIFRFDGELLRVVATHNVPPNFRAWVEQNPIAPGRHSSAARTALERRTIHIHDVMADPEYTYGAKHVDPIRTVLTVPMLRAGELLGVLLTYRHEVRPFTDSQIALLETFADQAAIAIENARLFNETKEALERQTATSEILRVISGSPTDIAPVFEAILKSATELCGAHFGNLNLRDGEGFRTVAQRGANAEFAKHVSERGAFKPMGAFARMTVERQAVQVPDLREGDAYRAGQVEAVKWIEMSGARSFLAVPLLKEGQVIGGIAIYRPEVRPFTDQQIALVSTFADQAVIAIENVRLFNETKEALERQTATAEILKVISKSPSDIQPVFDAVAESAARLCDATDVIIRRIEGGGVLRAVTHIGSIPLPAEVAAIPVSPKSPAGRAVIERRTIHIHDVTDDSVRNRYPEAAFQAQRGTGFRTLLIVPLVRNDAAVGTIAVRREEKHPFSDQQIGLLQTFADQAVIAVENVRLFDETKEALERQTATAEILRVISSSPTDVQPVFDVIARSAQQLFAARSALVCRRVEDMLHLAAHTTTTETGDEALRKLYPTKLTGQAAIGKAVLSGQPAWITDVETDPAFSPQFREGARERGYRSVLAVPMLREGVSIGAIAVTRPEPGTFSEHQVDLLRTFADQAVIAIENVRLFNETKEALEQQTATAEILKVIASSPSDVQPVFDAIVNNAGRLASGSSVNVTRIADDHLHLAAYTRISDSADEALGNLYPFRIAAAPGVREAVETRAPAFVADFETDARVTPKSRAVMRARGFRSTLYVPIVRHHAVLGMMHVSRAEPGPFPEHWSLWLKTFADQAAIAIENVRLFNETKEALEQQKASADVLSVISGSIADATPVFDKILESCERLFEGHFMGIGLVGEDGQLHITARRGLAAQALAEVSSIPLTKDAAAGRAIAERCIVQYPDVLAGADVPAHVRSNGEKAGFRSVIWAPMFWEERGIGVIWVGRSVAGPFSDKQIGLLRTFADQAVIAIENARLFKELQERTEALTKSVNQLTALGEVGQAISSTLDLETVLKAIVSRAVQLTGLDAGAIYEYEEATEQFHLRAAENISEEVLEVLRSTAIRKGDGAVGRTAVAREPIQISETQDESYKSRFRDLIIRTGRRALLAVPLMHEEHIVGALAVHRNTPGPFAREVVDLLKTFATQSALAIQNARLFREIAEKGKQLEVASHHKSQFLASMSHELRTPLNAILGFNEMMLDGLCGEVPAGFKDPLDEMQKSGKHLLRLINNVLDLAKIEAGRMELALADYSVHDTVESVRSTLRPLAAEKGLEFLANVPADIPLAYGDAGRIMQCLMNLAGNSLKFTKEGRVEISVQQQNGQLRYCVADTGIGIPPESIGSLFTEFKQTDATIASEYGGTGLGLSITKKFIEMHGGRIWVESEIGKGSAFIFEIPLKLGK